MLRNVEHRWRAYECSSNYSVYFSMSVVKFFGELTLRQRLSFGRFIKECSQVQYDRGKEGSQLQ
jgi:hypothetical protein